MKNLLLQMESNSIRDSCMRFCGGEDEEEEGKEEKKEDREDSERMEGERERRGQVSVKAV